MTRLSLIVGALAFLSSACGSVDTDESAPNATEVSTAAPEAKVVDSVQQAAVPCSAGEAHWVWIGCTYQAPCSQYPKWRLKTCQGGYLRFTNDYYCDYSNRCV
jgi:hypothetical protein